MEQEIAENIARASRALWKAPPTKTRAAAQPPVVKRPAIVFGLLPDPAYPVCEPLQLLLRLPLPRTNAIWGKHEGDWHVISDALLVDLRTAGEAERWCKVTRDVIRDSIGLHSWIEHRSGWSFDLSNGKRRPALVMRTETFKWWLLGVGEFVKIHTSRC